MKKINRIYWSIATALIILISSCGSQQKAKDRSNLLPPIFPDYTNVTIPSNIAPLRFEIRGASRIQVSFSVNGKTILEAEGKQYTEIPISSWHSALQNHAGQTLSTTVSVWTDKHPDGIEYRAFNIHIDKQTIDPYIAYRLIPPGYEEWNKMAIMQRNITSYEQTPIIENRQNNNGCINCHTFANYNPSKLLFHARGKGGNTVLINEGKMQKVDLANLGPQKSGTYPMWHPSGKYIVFSSNQTRQSFYTHLQNKIEVYDLQSDLILYDIANNQVLTDERFNDSINWETFPAFSPNGKWLYFCTARAQKLPNEITKLHYSIVRVPFNERNGSLGTPVDTIYSAAKQGGSASLPRISPDGRYLLFTHSEFATFPIQHREANLKLIDLQTNQIINPKNINSDQADSYHSWSSNGHWLIFSSRRLDGRYTRLFITSFKEGKFTKPFLLPQENPESNDHLLYSYNIPEFIKDKVTLSKDELSSLFKVE